MASSAQSLIVTAVAAGYDALSNRDLKECLLVAAQSGGGGGGVTQIIAGTNITVSPSGGTGNVTVNSTGGGSQEVFSGNYTGGTPPFTPSVAQAIAIDTSNGRQWQWYSSSWN